MDLLLSFPRRSVPDSTSRIAHSSLCTRRSTVSSTYRAALEKEKNEGKLRGSSRQHNTPAQQARHRCVLRLRIIQVSSNLSYLDTGTVQLWSTDPASASPDRINACFAIRAFAGVRTVCRQSRGKLSRNEIGEVAARPASARQSSLARRSDRAQISHTKRSPKANLRNVLEAMA